MKKRTLAGALLIIVIIGLGCLWIGNPAAAYHSRQLKEAFATIGGEETTLNDIVPFEWDTVYTFDPYTSRAEMEQAIGFQSRAIKESVSEGMVQLLFVKDRSVAASVCGYPDSLGYRVDFTGSVARDDKTVFSVSREEGITVLTKK